MEKWLLVDVKNENEFLLLISVVSMVWQVINVAMTALFLLLCMDSLLKRLSH